MSLGGRRGEGLGDGARPGMLPVMLASRFWWGYRFTHTARPG
jgi:hypothetical protein